MATLAADKVRVFRNLSGAVQLPIIANDTAYRGAAVGESAATGTGRPLVAGNASPDNFMGFTDAACANEGGAAAAKDIEVYPEGEVKLSVTGVTGNGDYDATVYAIDDDTFTLSANGGAGINYAAVGKVVQYVSGTTVWVKFQSTANRSI